VQRKRRATTTRRTDRPAIGKSVTRRRYRLWIRPELTPHSGQALALLVGLLREHVDREEDRIRVEQQESFKRWREEDRAARELSAGGNLHVPLRAARARPAVRARARTVIFGKKP
jgi:hypothetical protein